MVINNTTDNELCSGSVNLTLRVTNIICKLPSPRDFDLKLADLDRSDRSKIISEFKQIDKNVTL